jgi:putative ATP-grasp target RiPP
MTEMVDNDTFARDPLAPYSGQFPLSRTNATGGNTDSPSAPGVRPWNLRRMEPVRKRLGNRPTGTYDPHLQYSLDATGAPLVAVDPTAHSVSDQDGDEGANEDWIND